MPEQLTDPVVLLPGWGFDGTVFTGLAAVLSEQYHRKVKILDFPGFGDRKNIQIKAGLDAIIEPLMPRITTKTTLVGWSMGGMAAIRMAVKLKNRVSSVILLASTPCFVKKKDWPHGVDKRQINRMSRQLRSVSGTQKVLRDFSTIVAMGDRAPRTTAACLQTLLSTNNADVYSLQQGLKILGEGDLREDLEHLTCRVVMLLAENDRLIAATTGTAIKEFCPGLILDFIRQSGHAPFISELHQTAALLNQYLDV